MQQKVVRDCSKSAGNGHTTSVAVCLYRWCPKRAPYLFRRASSGRPQKIEMTLLRPLSGHHQAWTRKRPPASKQHHLAPFPVWGSPNTHTHTHTRTPSRPRSGNHDRHPANHRETAPPSTPPPPPKVTTITILWDGRRGILGWRIYCSRACHT